MLSKLIKNIRAKPEPIRKGITLGVSLGITGIIGFFWLISFINYSSEVLMAKPKVESPTSFLSKMGSLVGESYANVRSKIGNNNSLEGETEDGASENTVNSAESTEGDTEGVTSSTSVSTTPSETTSVTSSSTTTLTTMPSSPVTPPTAPQKGGVDLQDILTTKSQDNQENKATTSSEVLVQ